jgi:hypothetical protein
MKDWRCTRLCRVFAVYSFSTTRKEQITRIFVAWDIYIRPVRNVFLSSKWLDGTLNRWYEAV